MNHTDRCLHDAYAAWHQNKRDRIAEVGLDVATEEMPEIKRYPIVSGWLDDGTKDCICPLQHRMEQLGAQELATTIIRAMAVAGAESEWDSGTVERVLAQLAEGVTAVNAPPLSATAEWVREGRAAGLAWGRGEEGCQHWSGAGACPSCSGAGRRSEV